MSDVVERLLELLAKADEEKSYPPFVTPHNQVIHYHTAHRDRLADEAITALPDLLAEILSLRAQLASMGDAVAAETERCARVAAEWKDDHNDQGDWGHGWRSAVRASAMGIAAAIRKGNDDG
jgi:hypothetical protein